MFFKSWQPYRLFSIFSQETQTLYTVGSINQSFLIVCGQKAHSPLQRHLWRFILRFPAWRITNYSRTSRHKSTRCRNILKKKKKSILRCEILFLLHAELFHHVSPRVHLCSASRRWEQVQSHGPLVPAELSWADQVLIRLGRSKHLITALHGVLSVTPQRALQSVLLKPCRLWSGRLPQRRGAESPRRGHGWRQPAATRGLWPSIAMKWTGVSRGVHQSRHCMWMTRSRDCVHPTAIRTVEVTAS